MNLLSTQYFEYEGDNLISSLKTDINGKVLSEVVSETEDGNVTRQDFIYEDQHIVVLYSYDDNNELIKMETGTVDENGEITMNSYDVIEKRVMHMLITTTVWMMKQIPESCILNMVIISLII